MKLQKTLYGLLSTISLLALFAIVSCHEVVPYRYASLQPASMFHEIRAEVRPADSLLKSNLITVEYELRRDEYVLIFTIPSNSNGPRFLVDVTPQNEKQLSLKRIIEPLRDDCIRWSYIKHAKNYDNGAFDFSASACDDSQDAYVLMLHITDSTGEVLGTEEIQINFHQAGLMLIRDYL